MKSIEDDVSDEDEEEWWSSWFDKTAEKCNNRFENLIGAKSENNASQPPLALVLVLKSLISDFTPTQLDLLSNRSVTASWPGMDSLPKKRSAQVE